jgi:acyl dehydratase
LSTTAQEFDAGKLGQWGDPQQFEVARERIIQYANATNDDIPQHASGQYAPPVFAVVPAFGALAAASTAVIPAELLMMVLHGEQDFRFHRPIEPGMALETRAAPIGIQPRSSGVTVVVKGETRTSEGELVVEQYMTSFIRGAQTASGAGEAGPGHAFDEQLRSREPLAEVAQSFDADQTFRYAEAAGDPMPIHLDDELAKAMGLPGIIIHGLCTMAFTSRAAIETACPDDPARLRRLAVRFAKPVRPRQTITTRIWDAGDGSYAYETTSDEGAVVIKDGLAEIA